MRILIHGLNFSPELVGVGKYTGEMADWLAVRGHEVRAVTAPPFNPAWKVAAPFSSWRYTRQGCIRQMALPAAEPQLVAVAGRGSMPMHSHQAGRAIPRKSNALLDEAPAGELEATAGCLTVLRCPVWVPQRPSAAKRILHLASFALASFPVMLQQACWKPDIVLAIEPTLFTIPAALAAARLCRAQAWLHVQDFEADAGFELGQLKSVGLRRLLTWWERKLMLPFDRVSTISLKMLEKLQQKGVAAPARILFPNWVDTQAIFPQARPSPLRAELGIAPREMVALYAGTMARKQGLEILAEAASRLAGCEALRFVFCGEGPGRAALQSLTTQLPNVLWIPLQPLQRLNDLLNLADIHLLPQKADAADLVMPSKLTGMLASGRPVVSTARCGTQLAEAVHGFGKDSRGILVEPGDAASFADAISQLAADAGLRQKLGRHAREYAVSELERETILSRFEDELQALVASR